MKNNKYFMLFANCIPVKGFYKSILIDLYLCRYIYIPNKIFDFILSYNNKIDVNGLKVLYSKEDYEGLISFLNYFVKNRFGFLTNIPNSFPKIDTKWDFPGIISNGIIEYNYNISFDINRVIVEIANSGCKGIQLLILEKIKKSELIKLIGLFNNTNIGYIEIVLPYRTDYNQKYFEQIILNNSRIGLFIIYNSKIKKEIFVKDSYLDIVGKINFTQQNISNIKSKIKKDGFAINIEYFTESQKHNPYFNRKIYINQNGIIKNAPECAEQFGNIKDILAGKRNLRELVKNDKFQKYWEVSPDKIDVTKDSELRYMYMDNRIPYKRADGSWYYKGEPDYNPYIGKWKGEKGYCTLKQCGVISNAKGFSIDKEKIIRINLLNNTI